MGELLGAFASDLVFGLQLDSLRSCYLASRLAEHMGVSEAERLTVYYTALLKDAGCTSWTGELASLWQTDEIVARRELWIFTDRTTYAGFDAWLRQYVAPDLPITARESRFREVIEGMPQVLADAITNTAEVAGRIARRLGMPRSVQEATHRLFEQWDGSGAPGGLKYVQSPIASRIVLPTFITVPVHRVHGREAALAAVRRGRGSTFDPVVLDALDALASSMEF